MATRTDTQRSIIRNHLLQGKTITPIEALNMCGCFRLSAIIHRLRHDEGIPILMDQPQASDGKTICSLLDRQRISSKTKQRSASR